MLPWFDKDDVIRQTHEIWFKILELINLMVVFDYAALLLFISPHRVYAEQNVTWFMWSFTPPPPQKKKSIFMFPDFC